MFLVTGLINLGDGLQTTAAAILLCRKWAAASKHIATALLELGAEQQLLRLQREGPDELQPSTEAVLQLLRPPPLSAEQAAAAAAGSPPRAAAAAGQHCAAGDTAPRAGVRQSNVGLAGLGAAIAADGTAEGQNGAAAAGGGGTGPQIGAGVDARHNSKVRFAAAEATGGLRQSHGKPYSSAGWAGGAGGAAGAVSSTSAAAAAAGADGTELDERLLRAQARADWRQAGMSGMEEWGMGLCNSRALAAGL